MGCRADVLFSPFFPAEAQEAARKTTPSGSSPMVRKRQSAMSSLRASVVRGLAQVRLEGANAEAGEDRLHAVDEPRPLAAQRLSLAARSSHCLLRERQGRR